jgi:hypothetical protein
MPQLKLLVLIIPFQYLTEHFSVPGMKQHAKALSYKIQEYQGWQMLINTISYSTNVENGIGTDLKDTF